MIQIDMPMPDGCSECRFDTESGFCKAMPDNFCGYTKTKDYERPEWCPLKEQDAVEPTIDEYGNKRCGSCGHKLQSIADPDLFCCKCGTPVLWKGR